MGGSKLIKRSWVLGVSFVLAAGCGGGGGNGGGGGGVVNPPPAPTVSRVNLPQGGNQPFGRVSIWYLPRQGRQIETITAVIRQLELRLGADTFIEPLAPEISFPLNGGEVQSRDANVPLGAGNHTRFFDTYVLPIQRIIQDFGDGDIKEYENPGNPDEPLFREEFAANVRVFRSRDSSIEVRLNDAMVTLDDEGGTAIFNRSVFEDLNMPGGNPMRSFLSDYMMFDISRMASRPLMSDGQAAARVYFSGDRFALSAAGPQGEFEAFSGDDLEPRPGVFVDPISLGATPTPGEYRLLVPDPNDPSGDPAMITALRGMWRPFYDPLRERISLIIPAGTFDFVLMPTSRGSDLMQVLMVAHDRMGHVSNLYFGDADISTGAFVAYPVANLPSGSVSGSIQGTLSGFRDANGLPVAVAAPEDSERIRSGSFAISGAAPAGFVASGTFVVFR